MMLRFIVKPPGFSLPIDLSSVVYLIEDNWNDWWNHTTMYSVYYIDQDSQKHNIGSVKIGQYNMVEDQLRPDIPKEFNQLSEQFFSLGQDVSYYETLYELGNTCRETVLYALNDIALLPEVYELAIKEKVTRNSLLRGVSTTSVVGQYRRLANGNAELTPFQFIYTGPNIKDSKRIQLSFEVKPESNPPTNIHILIGRNAVGKTYMINNMIESLISINSLKNKVGFFASSSDDINEDELFANVVSVSFSAFDPTEPLPERRDKTDGIPYSYIGLKKVKKLKETKSLPPKSPQNLKYEFAKSLYSIISSNKTKSWIRAMEMLDTDPIFKDADVPKILVNSTQEHQIDFNDKDLAHSGESSSEDELLKKRAREFFHRLSSGHKIVLLTLTRLVETVEERTLVFLDEPEAHLHPPLLSAFTRALSDLLVRRNGVAIIATHSPVIVQEVPSSCVWKLQRRGIHTTCKRTEIETFGENIGALTREIFELEVTYSGFYKLLRDAVDEFQDYDMIIEHFNNELGREARAMIRALLIDNETGEPE